MQLATHRHQTSIKPEVHNVVQSRQRRIEPQPQVICTQSFVKIGPAVLEISSRTDRHWKTYRQPDRNTLLPYQGRAKMANNSDKHIFAFGTVYAQWTNGTLFSKKNPIFQISVCKPTCFKLIYFFSCSYYYMKYLAKTSTCADLNQALPRTLHRI